jgi:hypothetical protein
MGIMLGNLSVIEIEKRIGIPFPEEIKEFMINNHQSTAAKVAKGKWHCFDIPFHIVCGDLKTATYIYNSVKDRASKIKESLAFSIAND